MRFCTAAGSGAAGPPCPPGRAASCRSHRAGVPNPNPNPIPIPNPYPAPNPSPAPKPSPKPYPTFVLLAARIRWRWSRRPWTRSWSRSRSQKRRRRSGRARRSPRRLRRGAHRPGGRVCGVWFTLTPASTTPRECKPSLTVADSSATRRPYRVCDLRVSVTWPRAWDVARDPSSCS